MNKIILTYGTFDMYHIGHQNAISKSKKEGYKLYVGVASDDYVLKKGKKSFLSFEERKLIMETNPLVDFVFKENSISQWVDDFKKYNAEKIMISEEHIKEIQSIKELDSLNIGYFTRTENISTTKIKDEVKNKKIIITYGTYDLFHKGHINLFSNAKKEGDILIVGVSTDKFNNIKNKNSYEKFSKRFNNVIKQKNVDYVIPEISWGQKVIDFERFNVSKLVMGDDWKGKFDNINKKTSIKIFPRTPNISSTQIRESIKKNEKN